MNKIMESLLESIKQHRPQLGDSSLRTYKSILNSIYKSINGPGSEFIPEFFEKESKKILAHLQNLEPAKRKTRLSALLVATESMNPSSQGVGVASKASETYRKLMMEDGDKANTQTKLQKRSENQEKNWMDWTDIQEFWETLRKDTMPYWTKPRLNRTEFSRLEDFVILSLYIVGSGPRRLSDYIHMKLRNVDRGTDNYIDKKQFVFNAYKTKKFYGEQRVDITPTLFNILKKWTKVNDNDYLLVDTENKPFSQSQLTMRLQKIFAPTGKKISCNMLRHSYLTHLYGNMPSLKTLEKNAEDLGHSVQEALEYIKH